MAARTVEKITHISAEICMGRGANGNSNNNIANLSTVPSFFLRQSESLFYRKIALGGASQCIICNALTRVREYYRKWLVRCR